MRASAQSPDEKEVVSLAGKRLSSENEQRLRDEVAQMKRFFSLVFFEKADKKWGKP